MNEARILRVVVASPADVSEERDMVAGIVEDVNRSTAEDRGVLLRTIRWETDAYPGFHPEGPQGLIHNVLRIEDCDLFIGIFWRRFGTPTKTADSGTEDEIRRAQQSLDKSGRPQIMMYFSQRPYTPKSREEAEQWGRVIEFREAFPQEALWWPYDEPGQFGELLRNHLVNFIRDQFPVARELPEEAVMPPSDYFRVQRTIIEDSARLFVGRQTAVQAVEQFVKSNRRGYFVVRAGPGQGKTALACHIIGKGRHPHHLASRTGGRSDSRLILRSVLSQLYEIAGIAREPSESITELTKEFEETLPLAAKKKAPLLLVVDALDELPAENSDPPFLPVDALSAGVFVMVTARPGAQLDRLLQRLYRVPNEVYELGPLTVDEMRDIVSTHRPGITVAEIERIAQASQGNPLYLRAVTEELEKNPAYDLRRLPENIEGFFRDSTASLSTGNTVLGDLLGLLSVARAPLSAQDLSAVLGASQRDVAERGIAPIRPFLLKTSEGFTFYHNRFHEFVTQNLLYEDEIRKAHGRLAAYLKRRGQGMARYRLMSLAFHLFEQGAHQELIETIDDAFLAEKVKRLGYAVLEDVELLARCLLEMDDPDVVERCVSIIERLRVVAGGDVIADTASLLTPYRAGPPAFRTRVIDPPAPSIAGLSVYVGVLPKVDVSADFFEVFPWDQRLFVAIGDAPRSGLTSAFVARFVGNLFRRTVESSSTLDLGGALEKVDDTIRGHPYFERISMQCAAIDPRRWIARIASAGHPYPVHYSARRGKCDVLPLLGPLLAMRHEKDSAPPEFQEYAVEVRPGDVLAFVTDGLTEALVVGGNPYGYRFTDILESRASEGARAIGEAILDSWIAHRREEDLVDDVSVIIVSVNVVDNSRAE